MPTKAIRLLRAIWNGERDFEGEYWSFQDATSEPHPSPQPEIWVGGSSDRAIRRALELGDVWHPSRDFDADHVRRVKEKHPRLRVISRTAPGNVDAMLEAGAEGAVVQLPDEAAMRDFAASGSSGPASRTDWAAQRGRMAEDQTTFLERRGELSV